jgi:hypothetical protein
MPYGYLFPVMNRTARNAFNQPLIIRGAHAKPLGIFPIQYLYQVLKGHIHQLAAGPGLPADTAFPVVKPGRFHCFTFPCIFFESKGILPCRQFPGGRTAIPG